MYRTNQLVNMECLFKVPFFAPPCIFCKLYVIVNAMDLYNVNTTFVYLKE